MAVIKPGDGELMGGGKDRPPEGEFAFEFTGEHRMCGKDNQTLELMAEYMIDPEGTWPVRVFCTLSNDKGLEGFMSVIRDSGVWEKLMKKNPQLPHPDEGWDSELILKNPKFIDQVGIDIPGCKVMLTIEHDNAPYVDKKTGETKIGKGVKVRHINACTNNVQGGKQTETLATGSPDWS